MNNEAREKAWQEYFEDCNAVGIICHPGYEHPFKAGYDANAEEVERLKAVLQIAYDNLNFSDMYDSDLNKIKAALHNPDSGKEKGE